DAELPRLDGLAATERLAAELPAVAVVILTSTTELDRLVAALRAGAVGFLDKRLAPEVLVRSIRAFQNGESLPISRANGEQLLEIVRSATSARATQTEEETSRLTAREREVLELVATGARDREIARQLIVGESTV